MYVADLLTWLGQVLQVLMAGSFLLTRLSCSPCLTANMWVPHAYLLSRQDWPFCIIRAMDQCLVVERTYPYVISATSQTAAIPTCHTPTRPVDCLPTFSWATIISLLVIMRSSLVMHSSEKNSALISFVVYGFTCILYVLHLLQ